MAAQTFVTFVHAQDHPTLIDASGIHVGAEAFDGRAFDGRAAEEVEAHSPADTSHTGTGAAHAWVVGGANTSPSGSGRGGGDVGSRVIGAALAAAHASAAAAEGLPAAAPSHSGSDGCDGCGGGADSGGR